MSFFGDIRLGDTIDIKFTSRRFSTGAPYTLAGSPVISAYVGNGTTEITAGITLTVDFDGRTGLNNVRVVASSGNGFATATNVQLVITTGTVDSVSVVGEVVGSFSIENRSALMPTTAARTLDVSSGGEAGVDWANVGTPGSTVSLSATTVATVTTTATATAVTTVNGLAAGVVTAAAIADGAIDTATFASGTTIPRCTLVDTTTTNTDMITAAGIRTAVGLGSANLDTQLTAIDDYIDTEVAAIKAKTDNLPSDPADASDIAAAFSTVNTTLSTIAGYLDTEIAAIKTVTDAIGATGTGLSAIPWNASWDAEVQSEVDDALKTNLAEGYRATGAVGSVRDMLYEVIAHLGESSISATTKTLKKIDGSTTAKTYTLDSATVPTSITETT